MAPDVFSSEVMTVNGDCLRCAASIETAFLKRLLLKDEIEGLSILMFFVLDEPDPGNHPFLPIFLIPGLRFECRGRAIESMLNLVFIFSTFCYLT